MLIGLAVGAGVSFAMCGLVYPLEGVLVRYQADYTPKLLESETSAEGETRRQAGPAVNGLWTIFKRVKEVEGWTGIFKGFR